MALEHLVQTGDTVSSIAKRFNVPTSAISGFRSNDANVIFPDETLQIDESQVQVAPGEAPIGAIAPGGVPQQGQVVQGEALQATGLPQGPAPAPTGGITQPPILLGQQQPVQPTGAITQPEILLGQQQPIAPVPQIAPIAPLDVPTEDILGQQLPQPQEAVTEEIDQTPEVLSQELFGEFGISPEQVGQGFESNPLGTLNQIVDQVLELTGGNINTDETTRLATEIETLNNQRSEEIGAVEDDPFKSAGTKQREISRINSKFDSQEGNLVNKLTLIQSAGREAREQARFVANTAIELFGQQEKFKREDLDRILDERERVAKARRDQQKLILDEEDRAFDRQMAQAGLSLNQRKQALAERKDARDVAGGSTEFKPQQFQDATFALRISDTEDIISQGKEFLSIPFVPGGVKTQERRAFEQSEKNLITAILRKESGAAISAEEFVDARQVYVPVRNDSPEILALKTRARAVALQGLVSSSGGAFAELQGQVVTAPTPISSTRQVFDPFGLKAGTDSGTTSSGISYTVTQ